MINQLDTELVEIARQLTSLTVEIANDGGGGSGFIWSDGLIVTNAHVVRGSKVNVKLANKTTVVGSLIARDERRDLAAIKIPAPKLPSAAIRQTPARPGEIVLAMGSPWGFKNTLTQGIVHTTYWQGDRASAVIIADLRLAPGNSGGILADAGGKVIGINTAIYNGLALAIPTQQIQDFVEPLQ
ncbi:trypsin-like peptidase domain-containing protein [Pleurocapsales cyanobacterium LEGE 10410]|nr:trypsin-like peptidase domain-containing protein [Pleurocapsales cyanobacterium LEGE 10410]